MKPVGPGRTVGVGGVRPAGPGGAMGAVGIVGSEGRGARGLRHEPRGWCAWGAEVGKAFLRVLPTSLPNRRDRRTAKLPVVGGTGRLGEAEDGGAGADGANGVRGAEALLRRRTGVARVTRVGA